MEYRGMIIKKMPDTYSDFFTFFSTWAFCDTHPAFFGRF